jgi:hypothetical protein
MNCPRCGAMNDPSAPQCIYCGNPLAAPQGQPYGQPQQPQQPQQPYGAPPAYGQQPQQPYGAPPAYGQPPQQPYGAPPPGYGAPPPGYAPGYEQPPMVSSQSKTSGMAIGGFICAFLCGLLGLILSIVALNQINKSMGMLRGRGLAIAGIIIAVLNIFAGISMQMCGRSGRSYRRYYRYGELEMQKQKQPVTQQKIAKAQLERMARASAAIAL